MEKLIIDCASGSQYIITNNYIGFELSDKQTKSPAGMFEIEPQRLIFKFYTSEYPDLLSAELREVRYFENDTDIYPIFRGYSEDAPSQNGIEAELTFSDYTERIRSASEIKIIASEDDADGNIALITKTIPEWFQYISSLALDQNLEAINLNTDMISALEFGSIDSHLIAVYYGSQNENTEFTFAKSLEWLFENYRTDWNHTIYCKFKQSGNIIYYIVAHIQGDLNYGSNHHENYRVIVYRIFNAIDAIVITQDSGSLPVKSFAQWINDNPLYAQDWQDSLEVDNNIYGSQLKKLNEPQVYYHFPKTVSRFEEIEWVGGYYSGKLSIDSLSLRIENQRTPSWPDYSLTIKFEDIFKELLKLMDGIVIADSPDNTSTLHILPRLNVALGTIDINSSDHEELPPFRPLKFDSSVRIGSNFLPENHPLYNALIDYYENLLSLVEGDVAYTYYGTEKAYLGYKLTIDTTDLNQYIANVKYINTETEKYIVITVWRLA